MSKRFSGRLLLLVAALLIPGTVHAQQSRESMATDATATQWSFQFAYQWFTSYYTDETAPGVPRAPGSKNFGQLRIVAPIPASGSIPFTILPRVTLRYGEAANGTTGLQPTEIFALGIIDDWGTGRWGVGPLFNFGASKAALGSTKPSYGASGAIVNNQDKFFYGVLLTQAWGENATGAVLARPLGISAFLNYNLEGGFYLSNGDMVAQYDWQNQKFYLPIGLRVGKVFIRPNDAFNFYVEYQTSAVYKDWLGPAPKDSYRVNLTYTLPIGL